MYVSLHVNMYICLLVCCVCMYVNMYVHMTVRMYVSMEELNQYMYIDMISRYNRLNLPFGGVRQ